ncbi:MAG TPA: ureidoglycolate lyase [Burkholderiales bacterium]|nr:ureidoglycolate lyase [Burkholderiales bacterium]
MSAPRKLVVQPLTRAAFAAFGDVIEIEGAQSFPINGDTCIRYNDLAHLDVAGQGGRAAMSLFRGQPVSFPLEISEVERHPLGSQSFTPMGEIPFLIVVAINGSNGQPGEPSAFLSNGRQGVNYARGVWHHPLLSLGKVSDFLVIDRAGAGENCDVAPLPARFLIETIQR